MKKFLGIVFVIFINCSIYSQTQSDMTKTAGNSLIKSEKKMAEVLKKIAVLYKDAQNFLKKLRISQNAWLKFREAQLEARYPKSDDEFAYGSSFPMVYAMAKEELNNQRISQLMIWINGVEEGDVGAGSVKFKSQLKRE